MALLINKDSVDRIIKIEFVEAGCWVALEKIGIVVPKVKIAVIYTQNGIICATFYAQYLCTANLFSPCHLVCLKIDDSKLSLTRPKNKVICVMVGKVIT